MLKEDNFWNERLSFGTSAACVAVVLLWVAGSCMDVQKYLPGQAPVFLLIGAVLVSLLLLSARLARSRSAAEPPLAVFFLLFLAVLSAYAIIHPISERHTITAGNDSEDALYLGAHNLLHGHYPYYVHTYLHNPITPMPGALVLDTPFAAMGHAGLQNMLWFGLLVMFALAFFRARSTALVFLLLILANAHTFVNLMTGADYPVNCFYISISVYLFLKSTEKPSSPGYWASSVLLGLALSSRLTYPLVIPLVSLGYLYQKHGWKIAVLRLLQPLVVACALTLPFFLYDPKHFSPLHVANFLSAMTPGHQKVIFDCLVTSSLLLSLSTFILRMSLPRVYLVAALATGVVLIPPGLIAAAHQHFSVNGVLALGYTDTAYIFLCLWTCYALNRINSGETPVAA